MAKPRPKAAKGYKHAEEFMPGEIIRSISTKKEFELSSVIGSGGFGLIYTAKLVGSNSPSDQYAVKIEPKNNGPLFNESHVLQRIARQEIIADYIKKAGKSLVRPLGIPELIGNGIHESQGENYRFIILPLFEVDLQKIFENNGHRFEERTVYGIAVRLLDILEYLDFHGYVHTDLKAANILIRRRSERSTTEEPSIFLIDYGLASRFISADNCHKEYQPLKKNAHNGTLEYTSIDAHDGASPSRRGDLQTLGFCLWEWLAGSLPWKSCIKNKEEVKMKKIKCLNDLAEVPSVILKNYFKSVNKLKYDDQPDYNYLKNIFLNYLKEHCHGKLYIPVIDEAKKKPMRIIQNKPEKVQRPKNKRPPSKETPVKVQSKKRPPSKETPVKVQSKKRPPSKETPVKVQSKRPSREASVKVQPKKRSQSKEASTKKIQPKKRPR